MKFMHNVCLPTVLFKVICDALNCVWLFCKKANVMLEYTLDDAERLLLRNEENAVKSLAQVEEDLGFLRDQTTTIEVSILLEFNQWVFSRCVVVHHGMFSLVFII